MFVLHCAELYLYGFIIRYKLISFEVGRFSRSSDLFSLLKTNASDKPYDVYLLRQARAPNGCRNPYNITLSVTIYIVYYCILYVYFFFHF